MPRSVGEGVAGAVGDPVPHPLAGEERSGVLHRRGQVEDHRAQAGVPAAEGHRQEAVRAADVQHVLRPLRHRGPPRQLRHPGHGRGAHPPLVDPPLFRGERAVEIQGLAGAHEVPDVLEEVPLEELQEHLVAERLRGVPEHPLAGHRRQGVAARVVAQVLAAGQRAEELAHGPRLAAAARRDLRGGEGPVLQGLEDAEARPFHHRPRQQHGDVRVEQRLRQQAEQACDVLDGVLPDPSQLHRNPSRRGGIVSAADQPGHPKSGVSATLPRP